jgi:periplasmic protein TonB
MKLDIFTNLWLDIVFEGRNKSYGAYELRKENPKIAIKSLLKGTIVFVILVCMPLIAKILPDFSKIGEDKVVLIDPATDLNQKKPPPPANLPPPPPPQQTVVKFVKPVVSKTEEVIEEPPKVTEIKDKIGTVDVKGTDDAPPTVDPVSDVVADDNTVYSSAGLEVQPEYPGGMAGFGNFIKKNFQYPDEELNGKVIVTFVVEKDGTLTDIKVLRDLGYGTGAEAIRVLKKMPRWSPGEQNGRKVRCTYSLPIVLQQILE